MNVPWLLHAIRGMWRCVLTPKPTKQSASDKKYLAEEVAVRPGDASINNAYCRPNNIHNIKLNIITLLF